MPETRVLVAGATGQLGAVIVRKLLAAKIPVRALARNAEKLAPLGAAGAEIAVVDMRDVPKLTEACRGVGQIIATANNNMGSGALSPTRIDLPAYQNLCAASRNTSVRRLLYVSFHGIAHDAPVDIFRVKWYIEDAIRRSGVKHVMLRPTAFMDIWIDQLLAADIRKKRTAMIFGSGGQVENYIAVDDVAEYALKILGRDEIVNEAIELGGPSNTSLNDLATLVERRLGVQAKRVHIPVPVMKLLPLIVRPFNERAARLLTLGYYSATQAQPFPGWKANADRFGVSPRTVEAYIDAMKI
jgi:uncharacterized protein YbjT (DUF2867 family)